MRKTSVKNTSKSKPKEQQHSQAVYKANIIQTETATRNKSNHQHSKRKSELYAIQEIPLFKKHTRKQSGHQRKSSKISHHQSRQSESKMKTFGINQRQYNLTTTNYDIKQIQTIGLDGILTSRNRPKLPTNIMGQLNSFKNMATNINISVLEDEKRTMQRVNLQKKSKEWNQSKIPITAKDALKNYSNFLALFQRQEITRYQNIYYLGHKTSKNNSITELDNQAQYVYTLNDHISYRYQILRFLGKGSYGQVFKVLDHKTKKEVALKIIKNKKKHTKQAQIQINILNTIKSLDPQGFAGIVKIKDSFLFRKHQCVVFELLSDNLYQVIKNNNYVGLNLQLIKKICIQLLNSLNFLKDNKILHCDLKPENILLVEPNKARIKIIDFGSSCFNNQIIYQYIQSRYYRAPQITLGNPYNENIDMWSLGCILVQLYTGIPLFPGNNQHEQMGYFILTLGLPNKQILRNAKRRKQFFNDDFSIKNQVKCRRGGGNLGKQLKQIIRDKLFLDFIEKILKWNPQDRLKPKQALQHKWIVEGLPDQIRHLNSLFENVSQNIRKQSKQVTFRNKPSSVHPSQQKRHVAQHSMSTQKQNKSISKELKSKPATARKLSHHGSLYRSKQLSVDR